MYLVIGLGNIGKEYDKTRHNAGFDAIDILAKEYKLGIDREKFKGLYGEVRIGMEKVILLKPSTYMNLSGDSVILASDYFNIPSQNIIVLYDDISLDEGRVRIRAKGSAGGHNGIKDIIKKIGTDDFPRIKIGVGAPKGELVSHVLGRFSKEGRAKVEGVLSVCPEIVKTIISEGVPEAMNKYNGFIAE
ncbi:aminoacyl-tRNA hydrolase [Hathewaya histolytica]|uniref:aminoacyl-tRNA hydrolase n=1 Tax=Hathewaya histolytica TaxID=1498 RepID=UPI003B6859C3